MLLLITELHRTIHGTTQNFAMNIMFNVQLFWLLVPYLIFLAIFLIFSLINFYHILRWGGFTFVGFIATFIFIAGMILLLFQTYDNLKTANWSEVIYSFGGFEMDVNMGL
jgi:hypothetical protein